MGWLSINFHGSSKGNLGPTGAMDVVRDYKEKLILIIIKPLDIKTSHFVEAKLAGVLSVFPGVCRDLISAFGNSGKHGKYIA